MKTFLHYIFNTILHFFSYLWKMVCCIGKATLQGDAMQFGELDVTGQAKVEINFGNRHPCRVVVKFKEGYHHVPCNPKHHDELKWELKNKHPIHRHDYRNEHCHHENEYVLVISWHVTDVRTIEWAVYY